MRIRNPFWSKRRRRELRKEMTVAEKMLWTELRRPHSPKIKLVRQAGLGSFIVDFLHKQTKLVIEIDGGVHTDPEQKEHDLFRTRWLESQGYTVLRFTNNQVHKEPAVVIQHIFDVIQDLPTPTRLREGAGGGG